MQDAFGPVDVVAIEVDRLTDPQAGGGQKSDERAVGRRSQRRVERLGCGHHRGDVRVAVEERLAPTLPVGQQAQRRNLGVRVDSAQVAGEAADRGDPPRAHRCHHLVLAALHPGQRGGDGHGGLPTVFHEGDEVRQQPGGLGHLVSEGAAKPQVVVQSFPQRGHAASVPGQDCATARRAVKSTFA